MRLSNATATVREVQRRRAVRRLVRQRALAPAPVPTGTIHYFFDVTNPRAITWAQTHSSTMIVGVNASTKRGVRAIVGNMFVEGVAPAVAARQIRDWVPLHAGQRAAARNLERQLRDPTNFGKRITRFPPRPGVRELPGFRVRIPKKGLSEAALKGRMAQYRQMQLNLRARNIARTESIKAANEGQRQAWLQARDRGEIGNDALREWSAATGDNRTCPICEDLDGETTTLEGNFSIGVDGPPAHPSCRCSTSLVTGGKQVGKAAPLRANEPMKPNDVLTSIRAREGKPLQPRSDLLLRDLAIRRGYGGRPSVVARSEFNKMSSPELYRGISGRNAARFADDFVAGDYYAGNGLYGNGTYSAFGSEGLATAERYAASDGIGKVITMKLKPGARTLTWGSDKLEAVRAEYRSRIAPLLTKIDDDLLRLKNAGSTNHKEFVRLSNARQALQAVAVDNGRLATIMGYDALVVEGNNYVVVLNRTAVVVPR